MSIDETFLSTKVLKVKNTLITESLAKEKMSKLKEAKWKYGFKRV